MRARIFAEENKKWWTLAAVAFGLFMIMLDNTIVNVALPSIQRSLHMSISSLEWIVTAYALTFAALLITGGKLGDLYGRRKMFTAGLVIFTLASLACGPLVGGLIVDNINWHWIFYVNVPVGVVGIIVSQLVIRESRDTSHEQ